MLDYNSHGDRDGKSGSDVYKESEVQEYPVAGVFLGPQHGMALDSAGQVFCWGKGERGQLGQGRRLSIVDVEKMNLMHFDYRSTYTSAILCLCSFMVLKSTFIFG